VAKQEDVFHLVGLPLVENCLAGFNSSIFAYGQVINLNSLLIKTFMVCSKDNNMHNSTK
jgi:hypothetical protein